ncbi:MAG: trehalose-phosphatase [Gemmatimonadaceae bacterium]|nr:trehalose-phosphatase [Gemmatimonadaceae bacterium]
MPAPQPDWAYFVDLDGTLLEIAELPADVRSDPRLRATVSALATVAGGAVAVITGRRISEVDRLFPDLRLAVAGLHGLERRTASGLRHCHALPSESLSAALDHLRTMLARHPALLLEDKGVAIALHYRQAPALASYAHRVMREVQSALGADFCVQPGKRVVELKPAGRDKGAAIREFMAEPPFEGRQPVFLGDDTTDEYGFDVINELGGISIKVGPGRSNAAWRMPDVLAVRRWLALAVASGSTAASTHHTTK